MEENASTGTATPVSTLIRNGTVYDPLNGIYNKKLDVFLHQERVSLLGERLGHDQLVQFAPSWAEFDASDCLVCPGLIDFHVHCFPRKTSLGIDPDLHCLPRGVTTVLDAGSAGTYHQRIDASHCLLMCISQYLLDSTVYNTVWAIIFFCSFSRYQ